MNSSRGENGIILRFNTIFLFSLLFVLTALPAFAQDGTAAAAPTAAPTPNLSEDEVKGVQIVESVILVYSNLQGRGYMDQIRKTAVEYGTLELTSSSGTVTKADYEKRILRGESLMTAKVRLDQRFPNLRYALVYNGTKVLGVIEGVGTVFEPSQEAVTEFSNREWHGLEAFLRYKESGSKVFYDHEETLMGVDYVVMKLTDKLNRNTFYYVSKKSFRVMLLEYEEGGSKYRRKFYDYNYAQNTLFPYRTVLWKNEKKVEEQKTQTVTYGQEFGDEYFSFS